MYASYDLDIPESLDGALGILAQADAGRTRLLAGGTNLIVDIRARRERPERVVALGRLEALSGIETDGRRVIVGSGTTVSELLRSKEIARHGPSLVQAARVFAGQMIRNTATVGGNIACGSPAADLVPPLMSLDAVVELTCASGVRQVAVDEYFLGYKRDVRRPDEIITRISWPCPSAGTINLFYKLARRKGDAITVTGVAVTLRVSEGRCALVRIALGAVAPVVLRARVAEAMLLGETLSPELIAAAARRAVTECSPIDDVRASADYRRLTVESLTRRLLIQAWEGETCAMHPGWLSVLNKRNQTHAQG